MTNLNNVKCVKKSIAWGKHTIELESGRIARQADGAVFIRSGQTVILCTAVSGDEKNLDFLGLSVDYQEKFYAAGKIPGGYLKREGKPGNGEILYSRIIDRSLRPGFADGYYDSVQVLCTLMSYDEGACALEALCVLGASAALKIAQLPFDDVVLCAKIGHDGEKFIFNSCHDNNDFKMTVSMTAKSLNMIEASANEVPKAMVVEALNAARSNAESVFGEVEGFVAECINMSAGAHEVRIAKRDEQIKSLLGRRDKIANLFMSSESYATLSASVGKGKKEQIKSSLTEAKAAFIKEEHSALSGILFERGEICAESDIDCSSVFQFAISKAYADLMATKILREDCRLDGRKRGEIRAIECETSILPKSHGSALFTRGETQVIVSMVVGSAQDAKMENTVAGTYAESLMLHYNFYPYSVGEANGLRGTGRRELGHGNLALQAIKNVLPKSMMSNTLRLVSEVTESNGSSSMATVCGSSLALMDGGIDISRHVAGIAMGVVTNGDDVAVLSDITGNEDAFGCMDCKIAGTRKGITALQMDVKLREGVTIELISDVADQAIHGLSHILGILENVIESGIKNKVVLEMNIPAEKRKGVIGYNGRVIKEICKQSQSLINIDDNGVAKIIADSEERAENARKIINSIIENTNIGDVKDIIVRSKCDFGFFVDFGYGQEGLIHISEVKSEEDEGVLFIGSKIKARISNINPAGKINFSLRL